MHYLYILQSKETGKYYIGETNDIESRLKQHQKGLTSFGKRNADSVLKYKKGFENRSQAKKLEGFIKRQKSRSFIKRLIENRIDLNLGH